MDSAPPARLRRAVDLLSLLLVLATVGVLAFLTARRALFAGVYERAEYSARRAREVGASPVERVASATVSGRPATWMVHRFPDGSSGLELLVERQDGAYEIVEEGDAAAGYVGPVRESVLQSPGGPQRGLRPLPLPGRPPWVTLPLGALAMGLTLLALRHQRALATSIATRLVIGLLSLVFISFVVFVADELAPGDPALVRMGEKGFNQETYERLRETMGLNRPWPVRFGEFVWNAANFEFGESYYGTHEPVVKTIQRDLPMTLRTAMLAILLAAVVGILLGVLAGVFQTRWPDRTVLVVSTLGVTVPSFVLAPVLVYIFAVQLDRLPTTWVTERVLPEWMYLVLPVTVLAARPMALLTRLTRASMIDTLQQEFIRTAIAKGVPPLRLIFRHALRNAILPVITAIGTSFGFLLTGSFVIERAFTMPGLGSETIEAIQKGDTPVLQACILLTGALFILVNLVVDLLLPLLDPRIREAQV